MKYVFVSLSIVAVWIALILIISLLEINGIILPLIALVMTVILYEVGFGGKQ